MSIIRNKTASLAQRQHLPVSDEVKAKWSQAINDPRPAFKHGNSLVEQTVVEQQKKKKSITHIMGNLEKFTKEAASNPGFEPVIYTGKDFNLSEKARGWLRYQYMRCTNTENDDWSIDGRPHEWWDDMSSSPMQNYPRFDLHESGYFLFLAAEKTPAWREVYTECLDGLAYRYTKFWAAVDWNTQFGEDPDWDKYLPQWKGSIIPGHAFGSYNVPGWTGNGLKHPNGYNESRVQGDPLDSTANLFFRGWMGLLMGMSERVSGNGKWSNMWHMEGVDGQKFAYTWQRLEEKLSEDYQKNNGKGLN